MTKKCIGCGVPLQSEDKNALGYTLDIKKDYCRRCFRLKNYGEKKGTDYIDFQKMLKIVNKSDAIAFFLVDFLNINLTVLEFFKKIKIPKVLVISKSDTLRNEMKLEKISIWLRDVYKIEEDILFISSKKEFKSANILKYMDRYQFKTAYIMGVTNAGKSTFINSMLREHNIRKEILISSKPNTTLDFIPIHIGDKKIIDTPGFLYTDLDLVIDKEMKPITFQIKAGTTIVIYDKWKCYFKEDNSVTLYLFIDHVKRVYQEDHSLTVSIPVFQNSDVILPGLGFMNVKKPTTLIANFKDFEVRKNISEVHYE